jgi:predicted DNA-binding protein (MmcQ/YjbR family)
LREHLNASEELLTKLRSLCLAMPEAQEERAWVGTRWKIRSKTFAHVVPIADGWPPAYVKATGSEGPITIVTFRAQGEEHDAMRAIGHPFFVPVWWPDIAGVVLDASTDWTEINELLTESYRLLAPQKLRRGPI